MTSHIHYEHSARPPCYPVPPPIPHPLIIFFMHFICLLQLLCSLVVCVCKYVRMGVRMCVRVCMCVQACPCASLGAWLCVCACGGVHVCAVSSAPLGSRLRRLRLCVYTYLSVCNFVSAFIFCMSGAHIVYQIVYPCHHIKPLLRHSAHHN